MGNRDAAERFLEFTEYAFDQIAITPYIGRVVPLVLSEMGTSRQWQIKNFKNYLIFYKVLEDRIEVLRVLHGMRDLEDFLPFLDEEV
jgi:toxin ParE1/3/4